MAIKIKQQVSCSTKSLSINQLQILADWVNAITTAPQTKPQGSLSSRMNVQSSVLENRITLWEKASFLIQKEDTVLLVLKKGTAISFCSLIVNTMNGHRQEFTDTDVACRYCYCYFYTNLRKYVQITSLFKISLKKDRKRFNRYFIIILLWKAKLFPVYVMREKQLLLETLLSPLPSLPLIPIHEQ